MLGRTLAGAVTATFRDMNKKRPRRHVRPLAWLRSQGVWFWAIAVTATSVFVLWAGSQIAHDRGQSVEWYTGFGQWLGGLGSLIAAGVALWIAVTERRHVERQREADLMRQAALVQITATKLGKQQAVGPAFPAAGVMVRNRRTDRIFDIKVTQFVMRGDEIDDPQLDSIDVYPKAKDSWYVTAELEILAIASDQVLSLFPKGGRYRLRYGPSTRPAAHTLQPPKSMQL